MELVSFITSKNIQNITFLLDMKQLNDISLVEMTAYRAGKIKRFKMNNSFTKCYIEYL